MTNLPPSDSRDVQNFFYTRNHIKHPNISIGEYTYGIPQISIMAAGGKITIGKFCSIARGTVLTVAAQHRPEWISTYPFPALHSDWTAAADIPSQEVAALRGHITIGNDVWIGNEAVIMGGATIGDGAVIGAYAVVAKNVAPYSIVVGNPVREIRKRFPEETIARLLEIKWWDWPIEKIRKHAGLLSSGNIEQLFAVAEEA